MAPVGPVGVAVGAPMVSVGVGITIGVTVGVFDGMGVILIGGCGLGVGV